MDLAEIKRMNLRRYAREKYGLDCNSRGYCLCPFHEERNPSFKIYLYNGVWRFADWHCPRNDPCFSGSIIDFKARMEGISVREAIHKLKEEFSDQLIEEFEKKRQTKRRGQ